MLFVSLLALCIQAQRINSSTIVRTIFIFRTHTHSTFNERKQRKKKNQRDVCGVRGVVKNISGRSVHNICLVDSAAHSGR